MLLRSLSRSALVLLVPFATLSPRWARAGDAPNDASIRAARDLFIAAEKDEDDGRWADALEKLNRVAQVKPTSGVRFHTALCEEHLGRLMAALGDYKAAAVQARSENALDVLRLVDKRVLDSTERIPRLTIVVSPVVPEVVVRLDGEPIALGTPISTDPGTHTIDAAAPGRSPSVTVVTLQERDVTSVEAKLEPLAPPPAPSRDATARPGESHAIRESPSASKDRAIAIVAGAAALGLAAGGLGAYLVAGGEHSESVQACSQVISPEADACDSRKNTIRAWDWVGVGAWAGAAAAGAVAVVSLVRLGHDGGRERRDGKASPSPPSARIVVGPASFALQGSF